MRLDLTSEQQFFQETLRRFVETETPSSSVREKIAHGGRFDRDWWRRATELGFTSFLVSEAFGGGSLSGRGPVDLVIVAEELGRGCVPSPLAPANIVADALSSAGGDAHAEVLGGLLDGSVIATWAFHDATDRPAATLHRSGDAFVLDGNKTMVEAVDQCDHVLVTVESGDGVTQVLLPLNTPGVVVEPQTSLDLLRTFGRVRFDQVQLSEKALVGAYGTAAPQVERQRQLMLLLQCAEMAGAAAKVLEFTMSYAFDRYSFGRPLASYQALKHRFADMKMWLEASHAITDEAAVALSSGDDATAQVLAARAYVGDRTPEIIQDCVQIHGGIGVTWEHDIHLYLRRVTVNRGLFGTPAHHRDALASYSKS